MRISKSSIIAATVLAFASVTAQAGPVYGSFTVTGGINAPTGFTNYPGAIVNQISYVDTVGGVIVSTLAGAGTDDFGPLTFSTTGSVSDFVGPSFPGNIMPLLSQSFLDIGGFHFTLESGTGTVVRDDLTCISGTCKDALLFSALGTASGNGFDLTAARFDFDFAGSCVGSAGKCSDLATGTFQVTISTGRRPVSVSEPASLALMSLAIAGLAAVRRRQRR